MSQQKSALVTGVSTGIGRAIAKSLIDDGWRVFGSVRKEADGAAARTDLGDNFTPVIFDVTDRDAVFNAAETVKDALKGETLDALVNNAGIAVGGPLRYLPPEEMQFQLDVNLFGVMHVTQAFLPMLGADPAFKGDKGIIVNMSSVAGKIASPIMGPYAVSKHALEALSESLRRELMMHGIDVVIVGPGAVKTPIWAKADEINAEQYKGTEYYDTLVNMRSAMQEYGDSGLPAEAIGDLVLKIVTRQTRKTRHAILNNKFLMYTLPRLLPKRMIDKMVLKRFGFPAPSDK